MPPIDVSKLEQLKASGDLPSPKGVALAIMRLIQQDDVSMTELGRVIRTDPAFVGRLIKVANGVVGYGRRPVACVQDALTVLGLPAVRTMALGFSLLTNYRRGACEAFDYGRYWSASLVSAVTTQAISLRTRAAAADETYCLGLLASVGELALATLYPSDYSKLLASVRTETALSVLLDKESKAFAMNHAELSAAMLADWGLPRVFTEAVYHSGCGTDGGASADSREYILTQTLAIARQMAELCLAPEDARPKMMRRVLALGSRLSFDEETTTTLCDDVVRDWVEWGALLNVHAEPLPPFVHLSRQAASADTSVGVAVANVQTNNTAASAADVVVSAEEASNRLRILIAEQDDEARAHLKRILLDADHDVAEAKDGFIATELALDFQPDMMILAWRLPDIAAADVLCSLRKTRIGRGIYVIALRDRVGEDALIEALEAGADDVLSKPLNPRLLLARISAGQRLTSLHREVQHDREEIRHFAAELAVSNRRLQEAALVDSLTGFPNRRFFADRLMQEWAASTRSKRPLSCVMIDIDQFKTINDTYGHDVGDSVLRQVSVAIRQGLRSQDVVARTGGDEFLIMCPDTSLEAAMACAERVRQSVEKAQVASGMLHLNVTISAGAAARDASVSDTDALVKRADQGLYLAKQAGRNQVGSVQLFAARSRV